MPSDETVAVPADACGRIETLVRNPGRCQPADIAPAETKTLETLHEAHVDGHASEDWFKAAAEMDRTTAADPVECVAVAVSGR